MASPVRILIFADDPQRSRSLRVALGIHEDFEILGEGSSFREAIQLLRVSPPDLVILMGVSPLRSWLRFAKLVLGRAPNLEIVWIDQPDDFLTEAVQAKAPGILVREGADLAAVIRMESKARRFRSSLRKFAQEARNLERPPEEPLSQPEIEILRMLAEGSSLRETMRQLRLTEPTVKSHIQRIFDKLGVQSRLEAVAMAVRQGLLE